MNDFCLKINLVTLIDLMLLTVNIGAWLPIFSLHNMEYTKGEPHKVEILNKEWVVWKDNIKNKWSVSEDICPHKFAPLSQGRVDQETGHLECPYHGWQFNNNGVCSKIPQGVCKKIGISNTLNTCVTGDLLWGFFPQSLCSINDTITNMPYDKYSFLKEINDSKFFIKELPYSWDILVENFMDPAHIPFAHHGLQGHRTDGSPISIYEKTFNYTHCEMYFVDKMRNKTREGIISFHKPTHFSYFTKKNNCYKSNINVLTVPVKHGKSRVFMISPFSKSKIPVWLQHAATNRFLNTDIWLHDAEYKMRNSDILYYKKFTTSDKATTIFRNWWRYVKLDRSYKHSFGPAPKNSLIKLTRSQQINSWNTHSCNCKDCKNALKFFNKIKYLPIIFSTLFVFTLNRKFVHLAILAGFFSILSDKCINIIKGQTIVDTRSAAAIKD